MAVETFAEDDNGGVAAAANLETFQSAAVKQRLNQVDKIRAKGVGAHIDLPQLVVCGAQSAGKSSVLEGVTGIPFPREDGVCTKFATEIILRHQPGVSSITASIIPHGDQDEETARKLCDYRHELSGYHELPDVIRDVSGLMGIRGFGGSAWDDTEVPAFAADVLRIEVIGDINLYLTVVDLPGLVSVDENDGRDIHLVSELVNSYLQSSRTIILAVVQAANDIVTEPIIQRARNFDQSGERTVGIVTKPDLINKGTEGRVAKVIKNQDETKLKLGFFLLKNPSPDELATGPSAFQREKLETDFFQSPAWRDTGIKQSRLGMESLRPFLQNLLKEHIEKELPKVCMEIDALIQQSQSKLSDLGPGRPTISDQRVFLSQLSMDFNSITKAAVDGNYHSVSSDFFKHEECGRSYNRLRGQIHKLNELFATYMRVKSYKRKIELGEGDDSDDHEGDRDGDFGHFGVLEEPQYVQESQFHDWVKKVYRDTRGHELPGNYNSTLHAELFHEQSSRWSTIARIHIKKIHDEASAFIKRALSHVVKDEHVHREIHKVLERSLRDNLRVALAELEKLRDDETVQPITYNPHYVDKIRKARHDTTQEVLKNAAEGVSAQHGDHEGNDSRFDMRSLFAALQGHVTVDMEKQACDEAKAGLNAYYEVDVETFVDNVCRQVVERHLVRNLNHIFSPTTVLGFTEQEIRMIADEPISKQERRKELKELEASLQDSLLELRM